MKKSRILVVNCGSSSLKFAIIDPVQQQTMISGLAERLGKANANLTISLDDGSRATLTKPIADHRQALRSIFEMLEKHLSAATFTGIGHRVVHGGEYFRESVLITDDVLTKINQCNHLAPLHNPANITGIAALQEQLPNIPQVAVFDTAFHQSLPARAFTYALPWSLYKKHGLRRYGFHGTSHRYVTLETAKRLHKPVSELNLVTAHLGNGCSATAIVNGKSVDTTMGLTPLEGLVMGTRCGDVDPGLLLHLSHSCGYSVTDLNKLLNRESGLLGISGISNDMRTLLEEEARGNKPASLAIEVFCYRLAKSIASLAVPAYPPDALVFTGGIGENSAPIRVKVCQQLGILGVTIDPLVNEQHGRLRNGCITTESSGLKVMVVPTNEELLIAMDTNELITGVA